MAPTIDFADAIDRLALENTQLRKHLQLAQENELLRWKCAQLHDVASAARPVLEADVDKGASCVTGQLRKTKMCYLQQQGRCQRGSACPFAHAVSELKRVPVFQKTKLCALFRRGECQDSACKFAHGVSELRFSKQIFKTEICWGWSVGRCKFGTSCRFAHGEEELRPGEQRATEGQ